MSEDLCSEEFKHFFGLGWVGTAENNLRMAKSLGYKHVYHSRQDGFDTEWFIKRNYDYVKKHKEGQRFFFNDPPKHIHPSVELDVDEKELTYLCEKWPVEFRLFPELPRWINDHHWEEIKKYNIEIYNEYKSKFEKYMAWCDADAEFPDNLCILQSFEEKKSLWYSFTPDFQQQSVIEEYIKVIAEYIRDTAEIKEIDYLCKGIIVDVVEICEEINFSNRPLIDGVKCMLHEGITHEHNTFWIGWLMFLYQLKREITKTLGREIKCIWEPAVDISTSWIYPVINEKSISNDIRKEILGDYLLKEYEGLEFLADNRVVNEYFKHNDLGSSTSEINSFSETFRYMGELSRKGSWFVYYGMFDRVGRFDPFQEAYEIPNWAKLLRLIPNHDNLNMIPIERRQYSAQKQIYQSPVSYADYNVICTIIPNTNKMFIHFMNEIGEFLMFENKSVDKAYRVNEYLEETEECDDFLIKNNIVSLKNNLTYAPRTYIVYLNNEEILSE